MTSQPYHALFNHQSTLHQSCAHYCKALPRLPSLAVASIEWLATTLTNLFTTTLPILRLRDRYFVSKCMSYCWLQSQKFELEGLWYGICVNTFWSRISCSRSAPVMSQLGLWKQGKSGGNACSQWRDFFLFFEGLVVVVLHKWLGSFISIHHVIIPTRPFARVIRTASDGSCGGGLGTRLGSPLPLHKRLGSPLPRRGEPGNEAMLVAHAQIDAPLRLHTQICEAPDHARYGYRTFWWTG